MKPAIGRLLTDNASSFRAAETMLVVLATPAADGGVTDGRRERFHSHLLDR